MARAIKSRSPKDSNEDHLQYYLDILDSMPNIVYLLDRNCCLTGSNVNFRKEFNLQHREDNLGNPPYKILHSIGNWSEERVEMFKRDDINVILSGESVHDIEETPVVNAKNEIIYYQSTRIPLFNKNKEVIGLVGILTDVTEMRKIREQFDKIKKQLQSYNAQYKKYSTIEENFSHQPSNNKTPKVLMVEDNSTAQKAAQALLMQLDCHVDVAESGDKATALFQPGKYDLVFMDIGLEDTSGYVVSKKIRQLEKGTNYHVPIIALTGYEADIVKYDCDDYTMEGALTKPLTSEQAKQIIQHYIYHIDIPVHGLKTIKGN
ncbi:MAG: response regulator [Tatlockia sp.]|nr:response regulator [Tatlockia sp.]